MDAGGEVNVVCFAQAKRKSAVKVGGKPQAKSFWSFAMLSGPEAQPSRRSIQFALKKSAQAGLVCACNF